MIGWLCSRNWCSTSRIAWLSCPAGAAVELVENGVTGYLRDGVDDLVDAVASVGNCSPTACRERVEEHFSAEAMVTGYERLFAQVIERS